MLYESDQGQEDPMTTPDPIEPVQLRKDGSIAIDIDEDRIIWRPPRIRHLEAAQNAHEAITETARAGLVDLQKSITDVEDPDGPETDLATKEVEAAEAANEGREFALEVRNACEEWVRERHKDLALQGDLPDDVLDWPTWLPRLQFLTACTRHWGLHPFVSNDG